MLCCGSSWIEMKMRLCHGARQSPRLPMLAGPVTQLSSHLTTYLHTLHNAILRTHPPPPQKAPPPSPSTPNTPTPQSTGVGTVTAALKTTANTPTPTWNSRPFTMTRSPTVSFPAATPWAHISIAPASALLKIRFCTRRNEQGEWGRALIVFLVHVTRGEHLGHLKQACTGGQHQLQHPGRVSRHQQLPASPQQLLPASCEARMHRAPAGLLLGAINAHATALPAQS